MSITVTLHLPELFFFLFISSFKKISGHPSGCELVSPCGFDLCFPNDMEHLFLCFLATVLLLNSHYVLRWVLSS